MINSTNAQHEQWSSRFAFILAVAGSAVGLGNIWKFPYIAGENGGGAFVMVYLFCVILIGVPLMMAETLLGRRGKHNPIDTMRLLADEAGADARWRYLGWLGVAAGFLILSYYSVIAGWTLAYIVKSFLGAFSGVGPDAVKEAFTAFVSKPGEQIFWHSVFMIATMVIVAHGINAGLEKSVRFLMPALFVLLIILLAYAMTTSGYFQGLRFLLQPDFTQLSGGSVLAAMGQAFFTLSLGMGAVMVYGSYLPRHVSIAEASLWVAGADTLVALLAGLIIFPLVFTYNLQPASGPGLIFQTLPIAFGNMTGGWLFGAVFFLTLVFAALTSSISLIEPAVAWLVNIKGLSRAQACLGAGLAAWLAGLGTVFSFNAWKDFRLFDLDFFNLLDAVTSNLMLPIGGLGIAVFTGWVMAEKHAQTELDLPEPHYKIWRLLVRYLAPLSVFLIFLESVGVLT